MCCTAQTAERRAQQTALVSMVVIRYHPLPIFPDQRKTALGMYSWLLGGLGGRLLLAAALIAVMAALFFWAVAA